MSSVLTLSRALTTAQEQYEEQRRHDGVTVGEQLQRARIANVQLKASDIDNTGAKVNARVNILENHFTGEGRIYLSGCDTPVMCTIAESPTLTCARSCSAELAIKC